jgi:hypothetical protein
MEMGGRGVPYPEPVSQGQGTKGGHGGALAIGTGNGHDLRTGPRGPKGQPNLAQPIQAQIHGLRMLRFETLEPGV